MATPLSRTLLLSGGGQAALIPAILQAQIDRAEINGTVTDITGAGITGAQVVVTQEGTNQARTIATNATGEYVVCSLPVGRFTIVIQRLASATFALQTLTCMQATSGN